MTSKIIRTVLLWVLGLVGTLGVGAQTPQRYFPYPEPPESLATLEDRTGYLLEHFWDHCNWKSAFSSRQRLEEAFNDYASFMPYARATDVHASIEALLNTLEKNPQGLLAIAEMAEGAFYADTAAIECDECYLPFARAVADNKKLDKAQRSRFEYQAKILENSQVGMTAPDFEYTAPDGTKARISELPAGAYVLLFFNDPDCTECELARVRMAADININELIEKGLLKVVSIYPEEPTDQWRQAAASFSPRWQVGAAPGVDELFDMRQTPTIYYLNGEHKILSKTFDIDNLLVAFQVVNQKLKAQHQPQ